MSGGVEAAQTLMTGWGYSNKVGCLSKMVATWRDKSQILRL
jgi:hypothetical protein